MFLNITAHIEEQIKSKMKAEFAEVKKELKEVKSEWEENAKIWKADKEKLENRITSLESKLEKQEQEKRKNNIVFKGIDFEKELPGNETLQLKVAKFIQSTMRLHIQVEDV
ncbi:hypothetical protein FQR65_LT08234 [Abscondita terminalis]|nr:hypothetical protein FQR65_LT08234 [Abscondita terminalis]